MREPKVPVVAAFLQQEWVGSCMRIKFIPHLLFFLLCMCLPAPGGAAAVSAPITPGLNLTAVTAPLATGQLSAFPLLTAWKTSGVTAIESYDAASGKMLRAELDGGGNPTGSDFPLTENTSLFVYATVDASISLGSATSCSPLNLAAGFNLAGYACFPDPYLASEFLHSVGLANITSISRLDGPSGMWQTAAVDGGSVVGDDFPLVAGEGYVIQSGVVSGWTSPLPVITILTPSQISTSATPVQVDVSGDRFRADSTVTIDGADAATTFVSAALLRAIVPPQAVAGALAVRVKNPDQYHAGGFFLSDPATLNVVAPPIGLTPSTLTVWQGEPGAALTVSLPVPAPAGGTAIDLASSDPALVGVATPVTVPQGAASVAVPLTLPDTGSVTVQSVTVAASRPGMTGAQATLSVRPKPTISLSPLTTLTGLTFTYLLTVNLSDVAPPGGLPVTLAAAPAGIVSVPATVTIPPGASSAQVTVTATAVGSATISATSPGRGVSGAQNALTVTPIQTMNYGPVVTPPVGVTVTVPPSSNSQNMAYGPVVSGRVGVVVGSAMSGVVPPTGATGATNMKVAVTGVGLSAATAIAFQPATGITIQAGSFSINGSGYPEVTVDIDPAAPTITRTVVVTLPTGVAMPGAPGANQFRVTLPEPQILSMQPIRAMTGQVLSLNVFGKNFTSASSIDFTPATGISVNNPPTINAAGDMATVTVNIAANAPLGDRVVTITTPGWTSSATPTVANTFSVTADAGTTYTPLISREVGVMVTTPPPAGSLNVPYGPVVAGQVGVVVGAAMSGVVPPTGATGATNMKVAVTGVGLTAATAIAFQPATGITIQAGSFAINGDGNPEVTIDIDPAAPTITRTVVVTLPTGVAMPGAPGANQFRVTLPEPQILSLQPIRSMTGQNVSLSIFGKNFTSASSIDFTPATGISVNNPPTINAAGDMATVTVNIAANAPLGDCVVTITTPGWTSSATPTVANTFSVTADAGTTYTPLISPQVGVLVAPAAGTNLVNSTYGPVASTEVGVMVTPVAAPTTQDMTYTPIVSTQVGVAVGGVLTGLAPLTIEPGSTTTLTLTGAGLDLVTAIQVVPATGITVGAWTPAPDGLSGTVLITADASTSIGSKTLVLLTSGGSIKPAVPGAGILLVGYRPLVNSISPILPTVGTTFTLTVNGVHLQGATKVEILPSDNVAIANPPVWTSDGTGEHLTVTVVIDGAAAPGDRVVVVTTPYGVTTMVGSPANTITFFKPGVALLPQPEEQRPVIARAEAIHDEPAEVLPEYQGHVAALSSHREKQASRAVAVMAERSPGRMPTTAREFSREATTSKGYLYAGYRGPPGFLSVQESNIPGGYYEKNS
jgi:IPT/TIG domain